MLNHAIGIDPDSQKFTCCFIDTKNDKKINKEFITTSTQINNSRFQNWIATFNLKNIS